jgi:RNA polymerase sigma factor (sigma-70 family)
MHFRRKGRLPGTVALDEGTAGAELADEREERPEEALSRKEEAHLVHAALDLLPPHYARALEWKYLDRLPVQEIAGRLRLGVKAAESLLTRARRAFREGYERMRLRGGAGAAWPAAEKELES